MRGFLMRHFSYKDLGWKDLGEHFIRYKLFSCRWFTIFLHELDAPLWHPNCHDHPWGFVTILLRGGYLEEANGKRVRQRPGSILFRPATFLHNVITPYGTSWSLVVAGRKSRDWGFQPCERLVEEPTR